MPDLTAAWGLLSEERMLGIIDRLRRHPMIRKTYRQMKNGHARPAPIKPNLSGRRHGW